MLRLFWPNPALPSTFTFMLKPITDKGMEFMKLNLGALEISCYRATRNYLSDLRGWRQGAQKGLAYIFTQVQTLLRRLGWFFLSFRTTSETTGPIHGDWG